jgi:hypothetical protein
MPTVEWIAAAELLVILVLVVLLNRSRDHEVKAILDVMAAADSERAELINAARQPGYLMPTPGAMPIPPAEPSPEDLERAAALAKVGTVEAPE